MKGKAIFVIKKNLITTIVPLVLFFPMLCTLPFFIIMPFGMKSLFPIIPLFFDLMFVILGVQTLNYLIKFGNKKLVIYDKGVEFCHWRVSFIVWKDIEDVTFKYILNTEMLSFYLKNGKKIELNLTDTQLNISSEEIYEKVLEIWVQAKEGRN